MGRKIIDLTGQKFGDYVVKSLDRKKLPSGQTYLVWNCECKCGNISQVRGTHLKKGNSTKCRSCASRKVNSTHGLSHLPEYRIWYNMKQRCLNPNSEDYKYYGARGITVCNRWRNSFEAFLEDMGERPSKNHTIERVDVNGNYCPENCIWLLRNLQNKNKRGQLTPNQEKEIRELYKPGVTSYKEIAALYKVSATTIGNIIRGKR